MKNRKKILKKAKTKEREKKKKQKIKEKKERQIIKNATCPHCYAIGTLVNHGYYEPIWSKILFIGVFKHYNDYECPKCGTEWRVFIDV